MRNLALLVACLFFAIVSRAADASTAPQPIVATLVGYHLAFDEEFNEGSNFNAKLSEWGPISPPLRWIMHTPYAGDFGERMVRRRQDACLSRFQWLEYQMLL